MVVVNFFWDALWSLLLNAYRNLPLKFLCAYILILLSSSVQPSARSIFSSPDAQGPSLGSCQPHTHIMFLKTHKTASSTVLNMLYRFGEERDLHFALPLGYQLGYPLTFNAHRVKGYRGPRVVEFHIMGNHMRFHKTEVSIKAKYFPSKTYHSKNSVRGKCVKIFTIFTFQYVGRHADFFQPVCHQVITKDITDVIGYQCVVTDFGSSVARFLA